MGQRNIYSKLQKGHLELAKIIYSFGYVDIHTENDNAFNLSCKFKRTDVAEWLCELYDDYHIKIVKNKITKYWIGNKK